MKRLGIVMLLLTSCAGLAHAGKNAGGALIVHAGEMPYFYRYSYCGWAYEDPGSCENARTRSELDGNLGQATVVWFLAAFDPAWDPSVAAVHFGTDHNFPPQWIQPWGGCGPAGTVEDADPDWPDDPANAGNSLFFGSPIQGDPLFHFYWFACYGYEGRYFGSGIDPGVGYAAFEDDSDPAQLDETNLFGQVRWFENGANDCPAGATGEACCLPDGSCVFTSQDACPLWGGESQGPGTICDPNPCLQPPDGACCLVSGECLWVDSYECEDQAGHFQGPGAPCDPNPCPQPGACCHEDGICTYIPESLCDGTLFIDGTPCAPNPCPQPPGGACCFEDASCQFVDLYVCAAIGGTFLGEGTACDPNPCGGACCFYNGVCTFGIEEDCTATGGSFQGYGTSCDPNPCPQPGACCFPDGSCTYTLPDRCAEMGGEYIEAGLDCFPNPCGATDVEQSRTISTTWGRVKAEYR